MNKGLTYKKKNKILLAGICFTALFIYSFTFKKTFILINNVKATEAKIEIAKDAPSKSQQLKRKLDLINNKISVYNNTSTNNQQSLLELVTEYCKNNGTILLEFPMVIEEVNAGFIIETNRFVVQGDFNSLLSLVYILEQKNIVGKIAAVNYQVKKDTKTKETILTSTIYLQNIKRQ
jgi:hypothetical protein